MQYELYIDVFFLVNFVMDYLVLLTEKRILKCSATHFHVLLGAFAGAAGTCIVICIPAASAVKFICFHALVSAGMIKIGLKIKETRTFIRAWLLLYLISFLYGGILTWLGSYLHGRFRIGILFLAALIVSYHLVWALLTFLEKFWKMKGSHVEATLYLGEKTIRVNAVIDSGNSLKDALTGKPVHIISRKAIEKLTDNEKIQKVRYIPYHTIQSGENLLPVITIEKICLHLDSEKVIENPLLGISGQQQFGNGTFEMILHPEEC
ncbi:sigma-E processing peptidase SpoIIGA [Roseburia hominis]